MNALVNEKRCVGVAEIVEAKLRKLVVRADFLKAAEDVAFVERYPDL
jgi:hypothetical protein